MPKRREIAKKLGAHFVFDPRDARLREELKRITENRGADVAILAVPSKPAFEQAMSLIRPGGKVLIFANTKKGDFLNVDAGAVCVDEKTILGSYSSDAEINSEVARLIFTRKIKVEPLITHRFSLNQVEEAFSIASHPTEESLKIMVRPNE
jgi:L-iditol 2-dehydrogenase